MSVIGIPIYLTFFFFFFNDTATTEIYTLSLHDALPILHRQADARGGRGADPRRARRARRTCRTRERALDRKSTRLNSSHLVISYAVFCLKKKNKTNTHPNVHANQQPGLTCSYRCFTASV